MNRPARPERAARSDRSAGDTDDKTELLADEERPLNDINAQSKQHVESKVESKAEPKKDQT